MKKNGLLLLILLSALLTTKNNYAQSTIVMNEIYSRGTSTDPDWIELYNPTSSSVDISTYKIYDSGGQGGTKPKKLFPVGTVIPAKGFFVIVVDQSDASGFGLSSSGEKVWLENATGVVIDTVNFPAFDVTESYGRVPDGGAWQKLSTITRGASNVVTVSPIIMNEIYSRGTTTDPDWIELYNPSSSSVDISSYKIYDTGAQSGIKPKKQFPGGTVIPAKGFFVIVVDVSDTSGFGLSSSGEKVWLENASGTVIDTVSFPAFSSTESYGRIPDGGAWQILKSISRGTSNYSVGTAALAINEIYSRGTATDPDWIELYNSSSSSIDISSFKIYDSGAQGGTKPKKGFPAGTVIPSKGYFVIVVDVSDTSGFGLSSSGETVWLENASGNVIDSVAFPALAAAESYGRIPDGGAWQILKTITRGATNGTGTAVESKSSLLNEFKLNQNFPNPFNPGTQITYEIAAAGQVVLKIFDALGREIATLVNKHQQPGQYTVQFLMPGNYFSSGIYFYQLISDGYSVTKKMILAK